ncbi:methionyl-tRNA formyltransferase [Sphingobium sp. Cam5-1]|uniref:methionyl-tRNA formyltransferase n=1 Tax=Sphingobium sp. Cam5-1 TaxID=2789327 RepID=UPI0018AD261A|nr:formyltransferase family protein [Sphingobium sp. Cam5-1]QPI72925.1 methionyl-tRNA formyltransferase [Sphingobium sp. Cam5-1]
MKAIVVGAVESTRVAVTALGQSRQWDLAAVFTLPPDLAHRHSDFVDLSGEAEKAGARMVRTANINSDVALQAIRDLAPDYIFVIGWSQICGAEFRATARRGVVGYHPAPLPRLRGRAVIPWTILLDEPISASSFFLIDAGVDSGPLLGQRYFHLAPDETAATLYAKHMAALEAMLPGVLEDIAGGSPTLTIQDERCATYAARRRPEDALIDWSAPGSAIWRCVRACGHPYPGAWTSYAGEKIVIEEAALVPLRHHAAAMPGQIVERMAEGFVVRCGDDQGLHVLRWQTAREAPLPNHAILGRAKAAA